MGIEHVYILRKLKSYKNTGGKKYALNTSKKRQKDSD